MRTAGIPDGPSVPEAFQQYVITHALAVSFFNGFSYYT